MKKILLTLVGIICSLGIWAASTIKTETTTATTWDFTIVTSDMCAGLSSYWTNSSDDKAYKTNANGGEESPAFLGGLTINTCGSDKARMSYNKQGYCFNGGSSYILIPVSEGQTLNVYSAQTIVSGTTGVTFTAGTGIYTATIPSDVTSVKIKRSSGATWVTKIETINPTKTVSSETYKGVKIAGTAATEGTDYTISNNVITLLNSYYSAPTVTLVKTITYSDATTADEDVEVTLTQNTAGDYFEGTASIGLTGSETTYTVKVPVDASIKLGVYTDNTYGTAMASGSITSTSATNAQLAIWIKGQNLTNDVNIKLDGGVDGMSLDATTVDASTANGGKKVTLYYFSRSEVAASQAYLIITADDTDPIEIPITYSSTAEIAKVDDITPVSSATTWDWSSARTAASTTVQSPSYGALKSYEIAFANITEGWNNTFNYNALAGDLQYLYRYQSKAYFAQGNSVTFKTTIPGTVKVKFSNTGSASDTRPYRYLTVNGTATSYKSKDATAVESEEIAVPAGTVVISGLNGTTTDDACEPTTSSTQLRYYSITFTPDLTPEVTLNGAGYATFSYQTETSVPEGVTAYTGSMDENAKTITWTKIEDGIIPASEGVLLKGDANSSVTFSASATSKSKIETNDLKANLTAMTNTADSHIYVLSGDAIMKLADDGTLKANKAYFQLSNDLDLSGAKGFTFVWNEATTTAISNVALNTEDGAAYNLAGQRVNANAKGMVIMNGRKFINK